MKTIVARLGLLATFGAVLVAGRYVEAVVSLHGLLTPLNARREVVVYTLRRTLDRDLLTVQRRLEGWTRDPVIMNNENSAYMRPVRRKSEFEAAPPAPADPGPPFVVVPGLTTPAISEAVADAAEDWPALVPGAGDSAGSDWRTAGGTAFSSRHSSLHQITPANASGLKLVAAVDSAAAFGGEWVAHVEAPPVNWGPFVYWLAADQQLVAVDARTGTIAWHIKLPTFGYSRRGLALDVDETRHQATLYVPFGPFIAAVDATTGSLAKVFGGRGILRLPFGTTCSPVVWKGQLIVALYDTPTVESYDLASGRRLWSLPLHGPSANFEGGAIWSEMALEADRQRLFLTTGNPRPALSGTYRPGDNRNSNSVLAIDLTRPAVLWAFQEVRHDLWDFDVPSGPVLSRVTIAGQSHDVVLAVSKIGNTLMLDRDSGQPLFDFRLGRAPASPYRQEQTSPYQPDVLLPEPLIDIEFRASDVTDVSARSHAFVSQQLHPPTTIVGRFAVPQLNRDMVTFGVHGGAEWHGFSVDTAKGRLYTTVNMIPWLLRQYIHVSPRFSYSTGSPAAADLYRRACASCHLANRNGAFESVGEAATSFVPALNGITFDAGNRAGFHTDHFSARHAGLAVPQVDLDRLWELFAQWDDEMFQGGQPSLYYHWRQLLDQDGLPGSKAPWGKLVALDLSTGRKVWESPLGEKTIDGQPRATGSPSYGGLMTTDGGLLLVGGTDDRYLRAVDVRTGATVWQYRLAAAAGAPPITFEANGRQYVCVVASGGRFHNFHERASVLYIFALDGPPAQTGSPQ